LTLLNVLIPMIDRVFGGASAVAIINTAAATIARL
jgi:hypothetical protein